MALTLGLTLTVISPRAQGIYYCVDISEQQERLMHAFNTRIKQILKRPEYEKFALIGSGLQIKFAQTTIARNAPTGGLTPPRPYP